MKYGETQEWLNGLGVESFLDSLSKVLESSTLNVMEVMSSPASLIDHMRRISSFKMDNDVDEEEITRVVVAMYRGGKHYSQEDVQRAIHDWIYVKQRLMLWDKVMRGESSIVMTENGIGFATNEGELKAKVEHEKETLLMEVMYIHD